MSLGVQSGGGGAFNLETGSYAGASGNTKSLTFKGTPIFVAIRCVRSGYTQVDMLLFNAFGYTDTSDTKYPAITTYGGTSLSNQCLISVNGKTMKMTPYNTTSSKYRYIFDETGQTYYWFAITV